MDHRRAELEAYVAIPVPSVAPAVIDEATVGARAPQQVQRVAQALRQIQELQTDVWRKLDFKSPLKALQSAEKKMAEVQGRPPASLKSEAMNPGEFGGYDRETRTITLNEVHIESDDIREITDTVVHEGRHAYRHYAVQHPCFHPNAAQVEAWRHNFDHYLPAEIYGQEIYESQPIEADARSYSANIVRALFGGDR